MREMPIPRPQYGFERSLEGLASEAKKVEHTFGRFNLAYDKQKSEDFVIHGTDGTHTRYLVTEFDKSTENITKALCRDNIEHLPVKAIIDGTAVFEVPLHAKPLLNENLFPGRESSDTYISDEELFGKVGLLWKIIYKTTGCLPRGTVLASTGMKEFSGEGKMVFPVPPFGNCHQIEDGQEAGETFEDSIREELLAGYPTVPIDEILRSAGSSFREE